MVLNHRWRTSEYSAVWGMYMFQLKEELNLIQKASSVFFWG